MKVNKKPETDWISALAKESTSSSSNTNTSTNVPVLSKRERIEKRNAKKRRREERKGPPDSDDSRLNQKQRQRKGEQVVNEVDSEELRRKAEFFLDRLSHKVQDSVSRFTEGKTYKERKFEKNSFVPKLEEEFAEHVPGFFGKQRTKAMKKQLDGNMLWRCLADKGKGKKGHGTSKHNLNIKVDGKKLSDMSPDERVEAMIKLDMI